MVHRHSHASRKPKVDRRTGRDRRRADKGPPHGRDRRVMLEPRKPEVVELDVTPSQWAELHEAASVEEKNP